VEGASVKTITELIIHEPVLDSEALQGKQNKITHLAVLYKQTEAPFQVEQGCSSLLPHKD